MRLWQRHGPARGVRLLVPRPGGPAADARIGGHRVRDLLPIALRAHAVDARDQEGAWVLAHLRTDVPEPLARVGREGPFGVVAKQRGERQGRALALFAPRVLLRERI